MNKHALKGFGEQCAQKWDRAIKINYKEEARDSYRAEKCNL